MVRGDSIEVVDLGKDSLDCGRVPDNIALSQTEDYTQTQEADLLFVTMRVQLQCVDDV